MFTLTPLFHSFHSNVRLKIAFLAKKPHFLVALNCLKCEYLNSLFPLLLPGVLDGPEVLLAEGLVVRQLHQRDKVLPEQL